MVTALWWVAGTSTLLLIGFQWARQQSHIERRIFQASSHLYLAEGVIAREISRLKARPWSVRWYRDAPRKPPYGAPLAGTFGEADYTGYVQDVGDFWNDRPAQPLPDHVDLFLKVTYPRTPPSSTMHFFARVVLRTPSPERPTAFTMRRLVRVPDFDPKDAAARAIVLTQAERGERAREWNRAESNVYARVLQSTAGAGVPLGEVAARLARSSAESGPRPGTSGGEAPIALFATPAHAGAAAQEARREEERPAFTKLGSETRWRELNGLTLREIAAHLASPHIESEIALERQLLQFLRRGLRTLTDPDAKPNGRGRYAAAADDFRNAVNVALAQDAHNGPWTQPMAEYLAARAEWMLARTYRSSDSSRSELLDGARARLDKVVGGFKYDRTRMPTRFEAPHAYLLEARIAVSRGDPSRSNYNAFLTEASMRLEEWRRRYPGFMPWNEDAIVGSARAGAMTPNDEVAYWESQQVPPPALLMLFRGNTGSGEFANNTIFRWEPSGNRFAEQARMDERPGRAVLGATFIPTHVIQVQPMPGAVMGGQILFAPAGTGAAPQLYDSAQNTWRTLAGDPIYDSSFDGPYVNLADGRVMSVSWQRAQILDLSSERVIQAAVPSRERTNHRLVTLPNGRVLSVGGGQQRSPSFRTEEDTGEVYDPATNRWSPVLNKMSEKRDGCALTVLDDGRVLLTGGWSSRVGPPASWKYSSTGELYLPDQNVFWPGDQIPAGMTLPADLVGAKPIRMAIGRYQHWAVKLESGDVLLGGGTNTSGMRAECELYSAATKTIARVRTSPCSGNGIGATRLRDGRVLIAGGANENAAPDRRPMSGAGGVYDPLTGLWTAANWLPTGYAYGTALQVVPD